MKLCHKVVRENWVVGNEGVERVETREGALGYQAWNNQACE